MVDLFGDPLVEEKDDEEFEEYDEQKDLPPFASTHTAVKQELVGHDHVRDLLVKAYEEKRLPHSILLDWSKGYRKGNACL